MASVEVLSYREERRRSDYGRTTTRPRAGGWDEEDIRIRLRFIANAWAALRKHEDSCRSEWV
ncbi:hypothetical protein CJF30_00002611 [Rutstroemia sp. NJR-2017a BBW]|nr:hypothetical protein CJF30_00002611 [Rutstroemia sp. NJR-2017a BBW]